MLALTRETERQRAAFWPASVAVHDAASTCHVAWDPGPLRKGSRPPMFCGRVRLARVRYTSANGHAEQRRQSCGASEQGGCGMNVGRSRQPVQIPPASSDPTGRFRSHRPVQIPPAGSDPTARFRSRRPVQIPPALTFHSRTEPSMDALYISAAVGHRTAVTQSWWPSIVTCGCEPQLGAQSGA